MRQQELIDDLKERTKALVHQVEGFRSKDLDRLNARPSEGAWSALECLEHLNLYGDFYLPELERRILSGKKVKGDPVFKSGWFGERTVTSMLPKEGMMTMNAFKNMTPDPSTLSMATVDRFLKQQATLLTLLEKARGVDLRKTLTNITLRIIRFYLGTTFRFVIYHNQRHLWQADRALKAVEQR